MCGTRIIQMKNIPMADHILQYQLADCCCNLTWVVRFGKETTVLRKILLSQPTSARGYDYFDRWPAISDGMSELETVHGTGHMDVSKNHPDIPAALKYPDRFVGVGSFNDLEASLLDRSYCG